MQTSDSEIMVSVNESDIETVSGEATQPPVLTPYNPLELTLAPLFSIVVRLYPADVRE